MKVKCTKDEEILIKKAILAMAVSSVSSGDRKVYSPFVFQDLIEDDQRESLLPALMSEIIEEPSLAMDIFSEALMPDCGTLEVKKKLWDEAMAKAPDELNKFLSRNPKGETPTQFFKDCPVWP